MKVFISWSGEKSKGAALALHRWLPDLIQAIEPWVSAHNIDAGARWNRELAVELEETRFGVICVTRSNAAAPWLLFEAGALSKTLSETSVCPYLIDIEPTEVPAGPLTQFQAKLATEKETFELITSINKALKDEGLPEGQLRRSFDRWWPDLKLELSKLPDEASLPQQRNTKEMVEEILDLVRGISRNSGPVVSTRDLFSRGRFATSTLGRNFARDLAEEIARVEKEQKRLEPSSNNPRLKPEF